MASKKNSGLADRFCENFKDLRTALGLSQTNVAEKVGLSVSYVSMLERGMRTPPLQRIEQIGKAFKVPPLSLLK